jgi:hypothetical protein
VEGGGSRGDEDDHDGVKSVAGGATEHGQSVPSEPAGQPLPDPPAGLSAVCESDDKMQSLTPLD